MMTKVFFLIQQQKCVVLVIVFQPSGSKICLTLSGGFEAFRTSFPFVCTQSDVRSIVDREKFLTIYPSVILEHQLYLGK